MHTVTLKLIYVIFPPLESENCKLTKQFKPSLQNPVGFPILCSLLDLRHPGVVPTLRVGPRLPARRSPLSRALSHARIPHVHHRQRLLELGKYLNRATLKGVNALRRFRLNALNPGHTFY